MKSASSKAILVVLALGLNVTAAKSDEAAVLVDADQFACLAEQIGSVPAGPKGVYVNIRNCRKDGPKIMKFLVPPPRRSVSDGVESLLFLEPHQIRCIKANRKTLNRITQPAGPGRLKLRLNACGR